MMVHRMKKRAVISPTFEQSHLSPETELWGPRRCRHIRDGDPVHRQFYEWSARERDIIGHERYHLLLCVRCVAMLSDYAELRADFG